MHRVYAKDLESQTLGSLQTRISKNLNSLMLEIQEQESFKINRVDTRPYLRHQSYPSPRGSTGPPRGPSRGSGRYKPPFSRPPLPPPSSFSRPPTPHRLPAPPSRPCKICQSPAHYVSACPQLTDRDRAAIAKTRATVTSEAHEDYQGTNDDYDQQEDCYLPDSDYYDSYYNQGEEDQTTHSA